MSSESDSQAALAWNFYQNPRQPYDDFVSNYILKPLKFTFVQKHYDRSLAEFVRELPELTHRFTTVHGPGGSAWFAETIGQIEKAGASDLYAFLDRVATRSQAQGFLEISGVPQPSLMGLMDYLKQWWFPIDQWYPAGTLEYQTRDSSDFRDSGSRNYVISVVESVKEDGNTMPNHHNEEDAGSRWLES